MHVPAWLYSLSCFPRSEAVVSGVSSACHVACHLRQMCEIATEVCKGDGGWCCFSDECGDVDDVGDAGLMACEFFDSRTCR